MKSAKKITIILIFLIAVITGIILFLAGIFYLIPEAGYSRYNSVLSASDDPSDATKFKATIPDELLAKADKLRIKIRRLTPAGSFLVINTTENTFTLYSKNNIIRSGLCSTGSFINLEVDSTKSWLFETPKGVFTVKDKITDPVWRKPDWAFIEEGLPVPAVNDPRRFERGVLGDYALNLGNGYLIHGTLYQRLIGMPVTHGCVRLGDQDLHEIYHSMEIGSKVFIY